MHFPGASTSEHEIVALVFDYAEKAALEKHVTSSYRRPPIVSVKTPVRLRVQTLDWCGTGDAKNAVCVYPVVSLRAQASACRIRSARVTEHDRASRQWLRHEVDVRQARSVEGRWETAGILSTQHPIERCVWPTWWKWFLSSMACVNTLFTWSRSRTINDPSFHNSIRHTHI
jgi:hypothetical protein